MKIKEFLKPSWLKVLLFFVLLVPFFLLIYSLISLLFMLLLIIPVELIRIYSPNFNLSESFIWGVPAFFSLILVYLASCTCDWIYRKTKSKAFLYTVIIIGVICIIILGIFTYPFIVPYKVIKDSPAPGCIISRGMSMGGCFGKTIIKDLKIEPEIPCLYINVNNCNGGVLIITNRCNKDLKLGNLDLPYTNVSYNYYAIEFLKNPLGEVVVNKSSGNYASYNPMENETLTTLGMIGDKEFIVSYVKTENLC